MKVWLSEFTYWRLSAHSKSEDVVENIPVFAIDERGFFLIDLPEKMVDRITQKFGAHMDTAVNFTINHAQRRAAAIAATSASPKGAA